MVTSALPFSTRRVRRILSIFFLFLCAGIVLWQAKVFAQTAPSLSKAQPDFVWMEGEDFKQLSPAEGTGTITFKPNIAGWGHKEFLSGEKWLQISIDAEKVDQQLPAGGAVLSYPFTLSNPGTYEVWNRIGYEFVRSPFSWRIDTGAWQTIKPDDLTTDLMELETWNEVAWLKMGTLPLPAGAHTLEIRLSKTLGEKGKTDRILYASDALCLYNGAFHPDSRNKPGTVAESSAAPATTFSLPVPAAPEQRSEVLLKGTWEITRNDEQLPGEVAEPIRDFPAEAHWKTIAVPGDKNTLRPDLLFAHRLWYRTTVTVPQSAFTTNRSFQIIFPQNSLNTTVFVNGVYCGFNKNPFAKVAIDVTKGVKPGRNEVWVGIRDAWYGYSANPKNPMKLRRAFNYPVSVTQGGFQDLAYPIWGHFESGILAAPTFVASGAVYASDVFCKPSVAQKELAADVTVTNTSADTVNGELLCEVVDASETVVHVLPAKPFAVAPNSDQMVKMAGTWTNPHLWWQDDPYLYRLRSTVRVGGKPLDVSNTTFGFREWSSDGANLKLNGIVWHGWAELGEADTKEAWLKWYRNTNQRMMRFWGTEWYGMPQDDTLSFLDKSGVIVRRSGMLDGEAIGYNAIENDPDLKALYKSDIKMDLMQNWRDQVLAQVHGERNHPSVMLWSLENEWLYINCINLYGGLMDAFEAEVKKTSDAVRALDPTRLTMTDGGGANKDNSMPVHGNHYVFSGTGEPGRYPDLAYQANPDGGGRGRWQWDQKRPRFIGEDYFATGINPADYAFIGGESTFVGKAQSRPAAALITRMLTEGYRWAGYSAFHFWLGESSVAPDYDRSNPPVAVFCRQWDWSLPAGQSVKRTLGIFNDSHSDTPITLTRTLTLGGKKVSQVSESHKVPAGASEKFDVTIALPRVVAGASEKFDVTIALPKTETRQEAVWTLTLTQQGKTVFKDSKNISLLPEAHLNTLFPQHALRVAVLPGTKIPANTARESLLLFDPRNSVAPYLRRQGVAFKSLPNLANLPSSLSSGHLLLIGRDALNPAESASSALAAWASEGRSVVVLEQKNPLKYQGLPAEMETTAASGSFAFGEDLNHPILHGLRQKDLFAWGNDGVVYRNAYVKPTRGGRSLVQCDVRLQDTALVEIPTGKGVMLLSQLAIGEKVATNPVAQRLLANLLEYAGGYKQEFRPVAAVLGSDTSFNHALELSGMQYTRSGDVLQAITTPKVRLAVIEATPAHLTELAAHLPQLKKFNERGGWLFLHGLTPAGLESYNKIVGVPHLIRPFRRERVTFPPTRNPLTAGLTLGDVVLYSSERIFGYTDDKYAASDIYNYVVDYDDVAPFATLPDDYSYNTVNGFVTADAWKYIYSFDLNHVKVPEMPYLLPRPQEIREIEWIGNAIYNPTTKIELTFDGTKSVAFDTKPNNDPQTFTIPPGHSGRKIAVRIAEWQNANKNANVVGIDNIRLKAKRSPEFYNRVHPLLNIGGLMQYDAGRGGILLCNLLFKDHEEVPENSAKKQTVLTTLLRNLKAPFSGTGTVIAGAKLRYTPIDISKQANQYRDERGWFGDKMFTFAALPTGRQVFAGVPFQIYDFATSPVPTVIMLSGANVPNKVTDAVAGIPVNQKADALFFLHTARMDAHRNNDEIRDKKRYEMARYVVHYVDGKSVNLPIYAEIDMDDYREKMPIPLPGAQIAWTRPYAGTEYSAVAYSKQWNNPRPNVLISTVDMVYGDQKRGVPVLLAITAARGR